MKQKSTVQVIYNKEDGELYCVADSIETAERIILEDGKAGLLIPEEMTIIDLIFWVKDN